MTLLYLTNCPISTSTEHQPLGVGWGLAGHHSPNHQFTQYFYMLIISSSLVNYESSWFLYFPVQPCWPVSHVYNNVHVPTQLLNPLKWVKWKGNMSKYFLPAGTQINGLDLSLSFYYTVATLQTCQWLKTESFLKHANMLQQFKLN